MEQIDRIVDYINVHRDRYVDELKQYLAIPSVSALPQHQGDVRTAAEWSAEHMRGIGLENARLIETPGNPIVYGEWLKAPGAPTILFYGHYDVQPVDPVELWESPPFEATVREGEIYARGSADDKGQVFMHFKAIEAHLKQAGRLPINIKVFLEGEEEVGSLHLDPFVRENKPLLAADVVVISDSAMFAREIPSICYGLRGLVYYQIDLRGTKSDLHSGVFGGAMANPAFVLSQIIAQLKDKSGRIRIPGFYDAVRDLTDAERAEWKKLPFDEKQFAAGLGISHGSGEKGFSAIERRWARPTCDVNGITSGYQGPGAKTVIPSKASAKISMRLVPDQDPRDIREKFQRAIRSRLPDNCKLEFIDHGLLEPALLPIDKPEMKLAAEAMEIGFGKQPVFIREGGSIPVGSLFKRELGLDTIFVGFGLPDDNLHAPNEKFDLESFHAGRRTAAALYAKLAELRK